MIINKEPHKPKTGLAGNKVKTKVNNETTSCLLNVVTVNKIRA
jgi:hypothetical protein